MGDVFIGEVYVPLPQTGESATSLDRATGQVHFSNANSQVEGTIKINVTWGDRPKPIVAKRSLLPTDPLSFHGPAGLLNLPKMIEWILKTNFDPNDPRNMDLVRIRELVDSVVAEDGHPLTTWSSQGFFRVGLPEWLHRLTLGVGVCKFY